MKLLTLLTAIVVSPESSALASAPADDLSRLAVIVHSPPSVVTVSPCKVVKLRDSDLKKKRDHSEHCIFGKRTQA